jgi:hypothetical protein
MADNVFYANTVSMSVSDTEAVLIFKRAWPDHAEPEKAPEVCRVFVPKSLLNVMMKEWPKQAEELQKKMQEAKAASEASQGKANAD